jgi:hypothetical protein
MSCKETVGVGDLYCARQSDSEFSRRPLTIQHSYETLGEILCSVTMQSM